MKTSPANGSARSACCTRAAKPSMPLRKSTGCAAKRMRTPGGTRITLRPRTTSSTRRSAAASTSAPTRTTAGPSAISIRPAASAGAAPSSATTTGTNAGASRRRRCRELLPPDEELARVQPVAPGHRRDGGRRIEALGHDPGLLLVRPAPPPANAGDHLHPAKAVGLRTSRTTMITHRSRPVRSARGLHPRRCQLTRKVRAQTPLTKQPANPACQARPAIGARGSLCIDEPLRGTPTIVVTAERSPSILAKWDCRSPTSRAAPEGYAR